MSDHAVVALIFSRRGRHRATLAAVALLALFAAGCQARFNAQSIPRMNWLVMPFEQPPTMATDTKTIRGWWFGAHTIYQNPRAGALLAETDTRVLADLDCVNLFPSLGLKDYFARKRDTLKKTYPYLSAAEIDTLMSNVSSLDFARELGADKVLTGRIVRQYMADNRTFHWWWSVMEAECEVIDVPTGKSEWQHRYFIRRQFASMTTVQEELAGRLVEDLKQTYFRPLIGRGGS